MLSEGRNILLFGNLGAWVPDDVRDKIIGTFELFDAVILCERLFCGTFDEESERQALQELIVKRTGAKRSPLDLHFASYTIKPQSFRAEAG